MIAAAALLFGVTVPPSIVSEGYGPYANPTAPSSGVNSTLAESLDLPVLDPGAAGLWGWTFPALSAVAENQSTPIGVGTNQGAGDPVVIPPDPIVTPPAVNAAIKPVAQDTCSFVGSNEGIFITPMDEDGNLIEVTRPIEYVAEVLDVEGMLIRTDVQQTGMQPQLNNGTISLPPGTNRQGIDGNDFPGANAAIGTYRWAVRIIDTRNVIAHGTHTVIDVAEIGDPMPAAEVPGDPFCLQVTKQSGKPVEAAQVFIYSDADASDDSIIRGGKTDEQGWAEFKLDSGIYWARSFVGDQPFSDIEEITVI